MLKPNKIILGSQSPRRVEILADAGFDVQIIKPKVAEHFPVEMNLYKIPEYLSKLKMFDVYSYLGEDNTMIITADTMVIFNNKLVGKPKNKEQALRFLSLMNGKQHHVVTGVTMRLNKLQISFSEQATVFFKDLSADAIQQYIDNYETLDKAGAYNIQEYNGVDHIEGEFFNVMGLPLKRVLQEIRNWK